MPRDGDVNDEELRRRNALALSIIQHRALSERSWDSVRLALLGATVQEIMEVERGTRRCQ
ncbi:hypothetical protein HKD39_14635 [Nakamurella sp. DB0629]|uniref:Uncharacterized protein n=1 Tax=Nakamurella aerolata TaxID=1656892 RepID=A0A849A8R5_9ACTN|nr:hypothetical protein [Nakamurella aerolata]